MIAAVLFLVVLGPFVTTAFPEDTFIMLDGGWRILQGQVPHVDFYTPLGPVTLWAVALGMWLGGATVNGLVYANVVVFLIVALWTWLIAARRLAPLWCVAVAIVNLFMVAGATCNFEITQVGYAAVYNRYATVVATLVLLEALLPPKNPGKTRGYVFDGISTGVGLVLLFFLKLNFFVAALLGVVLAAVLVPHSRGRWLGLAAGVVATGLLVLGSLRFDVGAVVNDLMLGAKARAGNLYVSTRGMLTSREVFACYFLFVVLCCICPPSPALYSRRIPQALAHVLVGVFFVCMQTMLSLTNSNAPLTTLFPVGAVAWLEGLSRASNMADRNSRSTASWSWAAALPLVLYFFVVVVHPNAASVVYATLLRHTKARHLSEGQLFSAAPLRQMRTLRQEEYVRKVNDGCRLLERNTQPADRIVTMDFSNPFCLALHRPSPKGDALWWHNRVTFTETLHPGAERVFREATFVMVPKQPCWEDTLRALMAAYSRFLNANFSQVAESEFWVLYKRRAT
ncbi:MAG: hypothetical protein N3B01_02295 [Verrucomicrobiae bacterium]|nr:hypothetical protein [Verrucomicrobiae bacterium]